MGAWGRLFAAALLATLWARADAAAQGLVVIANASDALTAPLGERQLQAIYLLRVTTWADGRHIVPVNREAGSAQRTMFQSLVLKQDNADLSAYWNEMHFQGKSPPLIQESDAAVLAFVRNVPGAIGYVSDGTPLSDVLVVGHVP